MPPSWIAQEHLRELSSGKGHLWRGEAYLPLSPACGNPRLPSSVDSLPFRLGRGCGHLYPGSRSDEKALLA
jgi:hypothetical protein